MDRTQLAARLVAELAAARAAIMASYLRLWAPAERMPPDPDALKRRSGLTSDHETDQAPE